MSILQSAARVLPLVVAAFFTSVTPSHAGVVVSFDPAFGPSIPNLGFRGVITLDVTAACNPGAGGGYTVVGGACQVTPLSGEVDYYNASTNPSVILTSVFLTPANFPGGYVFGVYYDTTTDLFAGFDTLDSNLFNVSVVDQNPQFPINYQGQQVLDFTSGQLRQNPIQGGFLKDCRQAGVPYCAGTTVSNRATLTFTTIPEPDSIALSLLGLGALIVARRRKHPAA